MSDPNSQQAKAAYQAEIAAIEAKRLVGQTHDCALAGCTQKLDGTPWPVDAVTKQVKYS